MKFILLLIFPWVLMSCAHQRTIEIPPSPVRIQKEADLPPPGGLPLEAAITIALRQNPDLAVQELEPALSESSLADEEAEFAPELFGELSTRDETSSETSRSTGERFAVEAESRESEIGVRKRLTTGTEVEISLQEQDESSNRAPTQQEVRVGIGLTQSLLRGIGRDVNRISIEQADLDVEISVQELRAYLQALIEETELSYWRWQLSREAVDITARALEVADQQLSEIQQRIEVGQLAPDEELAAKAERSSRERNFINAEALLAQRKLEFQRLLNLPDQQVDQWQPVSPLQIGDLPIDDDEELFTQALVHNPALREAELRLMQNDLELIRTRNGLLPQLDFIARFDKTGYGTDFSSAREDFSGDNHEWNLGLLLSQDLGASSADAEQRTAELERTQAERAVINLELKIRNDLRIAIVEHNRALAQTRISKETLRLRRETAEAEQARFEVGTSTSLLVAQAQRESLESEIDELESRIRYREALLRIQQLSGTLLLHYGVEVNR